MQHHWLTAVPKVEAKELLNPLSEFRLTYGTTALCILPAALLPSNHETTSILGAAAVFGTYIHAAHRADMKVLQRSG